MVKKRGLGKSLDALLSFTSDGPASMEVDEEVSQNLSFLSLDALQRGKYQPRREMDPKALEELAASIQTQGVLQPLIVRPVGNKYEIIAGERRYRAAALAGLTEIPVIIRHIPDETAIAIALIENIQRENLNPIEEGIALDRLIKEFGMTHQEVAKAVGKSRTSVTNLLRLLILPEALKRLLETGQIEMGHARALITLPASIQADAANLIVTRHLSVRETENLVRKLQSPADKNKETRIDPERLNLQESLSKRLKLRVLIHTNAKGKGKLVIHYRNLKELDHLLLQFQREPS